MPIKIMLLHTVVYIFSCIKYASISYKNVLALIKKYFVARKMIITI